MKKFFAVTAVACFLLVGFASAVNAGLCEYHQWKRQHCKKEAPAPKAAPAPAPEVITLEGVYFDTGKATLKNESFSVLDKNVSKLQKKKDVRVTVVGYTDSVGSKTSNQVLSENRARTVMNYFVTKGIEPSRITSRGMGMENPVADNKTAEGRAQNRRIEIEMLGK